MSLPVEVSTPLRAAECTCMRAHHMLHHASATTAALISVRHLSCLEGMLGLCEQRQCELCHWMACPARRGNKVQKDRMASQRAECNAPCYRMRARMQGHFHGPG